MDEVAPLILEIASDIARFGVGYGDVGVVEIKVHSWGIIQKTQIQRDVFYRKSPHPYLFAFSTIFFILLLF